MYIFRFEELIELKLYYSNAALFDTALFKNRMKNVLSKNNIDPVENITHVF